MIGAHLIQSYISSSKRSATDTEKNVWKTFSLTLVFALCLSFLLQSSSRRVITFVKAAKETGAKDRVYYQLKPALILMYRFCKYKETSKRKYKDFNVFQS